MAMSEGFGGGVIFQQHWWDTMGSVICCGLGPTRKSCGNHPEVGFSTIGGVKIAKEMWEFVRNNLGND